MEKTATPYLNTNAKFWIVKPEVGISGVSGLETLISGTYIDMFSAKDGEPKKSFHGLTQMYRYDEDGMYFQLRAPSSYNIKKGTPVYFKNIKAGQVENVYISLDGQNVEFVVFISNLYVPYVHRSSKFWVTSAVEMSLAHGRLDVNVAPVTHLVQGGIEFSSRGEDTSDKVPDKFVFRLHKNASLAEGQVIGKGGDFVNTFEILTEDSIAKLKRGALVQYEGYEVGRVNDIALSYNQDTHKIQGRVLVDIDLSSFASKLDDITSCQKKFYQALEEGLSAKISSADPFTGTLFVDLVFETNNTQRSVIHGEHFVRLPSVPNDTRGIVEGIEKLVASLNKVVDDNAEPIGKIVADLQQSVNNLKAMTESKSFQMMPDELNKTMKELTTTLQTAKKVLKGYDSNSLLTHQIAQTLKDVTETSQEMEEFLKMLNRKPNSLIFGDK